MASIILRKMWSSFSIGSSSNSAGGNSGGGKGGRSFIDRPSYSVSLQSRGSTGMFHQIPDEILILILKSLGPKETAKLATVCKTWRVVISENANLWIYFLQSDPLLPWDSVFFAETQLRYGIPLQVMYDQTPQLNFMNIYGLRAKVPGAIIIDGGSGYCKFGWSKYLCPSGRSATFLEFGNIETPIYSRLRHFYATIYSRMQVKTNTQSIVVSIPICHYDDTESARASRIQLKEAIYSALFDMNVPAICAINQATLALYAARRTSGIVVNIGFNQTSVVPILHGEVRREVGVEVVGMGALKLTGFLREQMQLKNMNFESLYTVRELKENLCYVALDYVSELSKDTKASYEVSPEGSFTLSKERFQTGEILFQPQIAGVRVMGLHQAVALCIHHCYDAELMGDCSWFKTVVLSGGSACLPGLADRLEKELHELLPPSIANGIRVLPPPFGVDSAWFGAKMIANLSSFSEAWCMTKKQFKNKSRRNLIGSW